MRRPSLDSSTATPAATRKALKAAEREKDLARFYVQIAADLAKEAHEEHHHLRRGVWELSPSAALGPLACVFNSYPYARYPKRRDQELAALREAMTDAGMTEVASTSYPLPGEADEGYTRAMIVRLASPDDVGLLATLCDRAVTRAAIEAGDELPTVARHFVTEKPDSAADREMRERFLLGRKADFRKAIGAALRANAGRTMTKDAIAAATSGQGHELLVPIDEVLAEMVRDGQIEPSYTAKRASKRKA